MTVLTERPETVGMDEMQRDQPVNAANLGTAADFGKPPQIEEQMSFNHNPHGGVSTAL